MLTLQFTRLLDTFKNLNIPETMNGKKITAGIKYAISTGNWGIQDIFFILSKNTYNNQRNFFMFTFADTVSRSKAHRTESHRF